MRAYLSRCRPQYRTHLSLENLRALLLSIVRQGVLGRARLSYWKFVLVAATRYRRYFGAAMTMAVMGYHFQMITDHISGSES